MNLLKLNFNLLLLAITTANANSIIGFGSGTTGGQGGVEYHVNSFKELVSALKNNGNPNAPKIIYIDSPLNGLMDENGKTYTAEDLLPEYSFEEYIKCFTEDGSAWYDTEECNKIDEIRKSGIAIQDSLTRAYITSNTSIIGQGDKTPIEEISFYLKNINNVIIKNLSIEAPNDLFPAWSVEDGKHGAWKAEYDNIVIRNTTNVWVDNCYLTDGKKHIGTAPVIFGQYIDKHDGLLDIVQVSDNVTISNNRFQSHRKTMLIGNGDNKTDDRNHLRVTIFNNVFIDCAERLPRVRFGKVHVFNNYYYAESFNPAYPSLTIENYFHDDVTANPQYFIGLGVESDILSEYNSFNFVGNDDIPATTDIIVFSYGGYTFHDEGSEYNGTPINVDEIAEKSFNFKAEVTINQNAIKGKTNPEWVNATFTSETFQPRDFYDYELNKNIDEINDLINKVPTWMFDIDEIDDLESTYELETEFINEEYYLKNESITKEYDLETESITEGYDLETESITEKYIDIYY